MAWPWTHRTLQWWPLVWGVLPVLAFPSLLSSWLPLPPQSASCLSPLQQNKIRLALAHSPFPKSLKLRLLGLGSGHKANSSWEWGFCVLFSASFHKALNTLWPSDHERVPRRPGINIPLSVLYLGEQPDPKTFWEILQNEVPKSFGEILESWEHSSWSLTMFNGVSDGSATSDKSSGRSEAHLIQGECPLLLINIYCQHSWHYPFYKGERGEISRNIYISYQWTIPSQ